MAHATATSSKGSAGETLSLIDYLNRANPRVNSQNSWKGNNTASSTWTQTEPKELIEWEDFDYRTLQAMYGDILKLEIHHDELPDFSRHLPNHLCDIRDEDSLEALLIRWNNAVVSYALSMAQKDHRTSGERGEIHMARGGQASIGAKKGSRPDWAGIISGQRDGKRQSYENVLPGDSKLSTKWTSSGDRRSVEFRKPLAQIFRYCERARVRYGYLLTQEELVAVRVSIRAPSPTPDTAARRQRRRRTTPRGHSHKPGTPKGAMPVPMPREPAAIHRVLEYKSVPWDCRGGSDDDESTLSINLALWWLHMMAATERALGSAYRQLRSEQRAGSSGAFETAVGAREGALAAEEGSFLPLVRKRQRRDESWSDGSADGRGEAEGRKVHRSFASAMSF